MTEQPYAVPAVTRQRAIPEVATELPPPPPERLDRRNVRHPERRRDSGPLFTGRAAIVAVPPVGRWRTP